MNRRGFLKGAASAAGGVVAAAVGAQAAETPDAFTYRGWSVRFRSCEPVNQDIWIGIWFAHKEGREKGWASTTMGTCHEYRDLECIDMCKKRGWPVLNCFAPEGAREECKRRALETLLQKL